MVAVMVLAAGMSRRYAGENKLLLPFGRGTVISTVVTSVAHSAARPIVIVTGHQATQVEEALGGLSPFPIAFVHNPDYQTGEMLSSIKTGIRYLLPGSATAVMVVLGDQPLIPLHLIERLAVAFERGCGDLIAPRFGIDGRRGHPVVIGRRWWDNVLALPAGGNVRDLLTANRTRLTCLVVSRDYAFGDIDTPEAYREALTRTTE